MDYCLQFNRHCGGSSTRTYDLIYIFRDQSFCWEEISIDHVFLSVISSFFFFFFLQNGKFLSYIIVITVIPSLSTLASLPV